MNTGRRAVFLDVDGTYAHHGAVPPAHEDAVRAARANGHAVFLCTGRPVSLIPTHLLAAGFDGIVAGAGAHVTVDGKVIADERIPQHLLRRTLELLDAAGTQYLLEAPEASYAKPAAAALLAERAALSATPAFAHLSGLRDISAALVVQEDLAGVGTTKITAFDGQTLLGDIVATVNADGDEPLAVFPSSIADLGPGSGEVFVARITKAVGLAIAADALGIPREHTIAMGDHLNDLEMIRHAGVGVAMADGHADVIAAADLVVPGPTQNGVAVAFERLGLI